MVGLRTHMPHHGPLSCWLEFKSLLRLVLTSGFGREGRVALREYLALSVWCRSVRRPGRLYESIERLTRHSAATKHTRKDDLWLVVGAIQCASRFHPRATCLERNLRLMVHLQRSGASGARINVGVRRGAFGYHGHIWAEVGGRYPFDPPDISSRYEFVWPLQDLLEKGGHATPMGKLTICDGVIMQELGDEDEAVVLDLKRGLYFGLNVTALRIWREIEADGSVAKTRAAMVKEFPDDEERLRRDIDDLLASLLSAGLIAEVGD